MAINMTRILVFSDSHNDTYNMEKVIKNIKDVDCILHLGDIHRDVEFLKDEFPQIPLHFVQGNNDPNHFYKFDKLITIDGINIFMTHGHHYMVNKDPRCLLRADMAKTANIILYGHTHIAEYINENGVIIANPGSISKPRIGNTSYGVIEILDGKFSYANIEVY